MAIIHKGLFSWQEIDSKSDLQRLDLVLKSLPDEKLMKLLEKERAQGRDDNPIRAVWNSVIAGIVYEHVSIASLIRELRRNAELREICGFDLFKGSSAVPSAFAYSRFLKKLMVHTQEIEDIFDHLVSKLAELLPDFGEKLAIDSKALNSHARPNKNNKSDGRRDIDADWGKKRYKYKDKNGHIWEKVKSWFGYKVHIMVDSTYELPISYKVTKASRSDSPELLNLVEELNSKNKSLIERANEMAGDRGYDSADNNEKLYDTYGIKPILGIREMWKDGEDNRLLNPDKVDNIVYDEKGNVYCYCPVTGNKRDMAFMGYEKNRKTLKYRCPAQTYGYCCKGKSRCTKTNSDYGRIERISLDKNRRIFTPIARSSYAWDRAYKKRTAVERVNSRLDVSFGFERHFIRGGKKMQLRVGLAMIVMLALAVGHTKEKDHEQMRSLVCVKD